jgi:hypothetical protein
MKRWLAIALLLALVPSARAADDERKKGDEKKGGAEPATWYAQRLTHGDTGVAVEHFWSKGRKLRAEIVVQGAVVQTLVSGELYRIIDQTNLAGVQIRRSKEALALDAKEPRARPFATEGEEFIAAGAELVRSDNIGGRPCRVYRLTNDRGKREVWISDDKKKLPLRIEFWARESGVHTTTDYIDWISDLPLPDTFFEPDPRANLETIEHADYVARAEKGPVGPAPVLFSPLLHGK